MPSATKKRIDVLKMFFDVLILVPPAVEFVDVKIIAPGKALCYVPQFTLNTFSMLLGVDTF